MSDSIEDGLIDSYLNETLSWDFFEYDLNPERIRSRVEAALSKKYNSKQFLKMVLKRLEKRNLGGEDVEAELKYNRFEDLRTTIDSFLDDKDLAQITTADVRLHVEAVMPKFEFKKNFISRIIYKQARKVTVTRMIDAYISGKDLDKVTSKEVRLHVAAALSKKVRILNFRALVVQRVVMAYQKTKVVPLAKHLVENRRMRMADGVIDIKKVISIQQQIEKNGQAMEQYIKDQVIRHGLLYMCS